MKRFKNILYLVDSTTMGSPGSGEKIAHFARMNGAKVTMMYVEDTTPFEELGKLLSGRFENIQRELMQYHRRDIEEFTGHERWQRVDVASHICEGKDFIEIIRKVIRDGHDLVIKEESLDQGIDQLAMRLVRKCPCPVWMIKRGSYSFGRVLAALDVGRGSEESFRLNKKIVELSNSLALRENGEAFYLHVWKLEYETMLRSSKFNLSTSDIIQLKESIVKERSSGLSKLIETCLVSSTEGQIVVKEGETEEIIRQMVERLGIDVLVMGSVGRVGIPGVLIGNKAETLLSRINCTVLTVKPDGFLTPVKIE